MKKIAFITFLLISLIAKGFSQSIIYDLMRTKPDTKTFSDTLFAMDISFEKCNSNWVTNNEWGNCIWTHIDLWENYMKQNYDTLISLLDTTGQRVVKKSQDNWKKNYDSEENLAYYIMRLPSAPFGREDDFKNGYSKLYAIRTRALELKSCIEVVRLSKGILK